MPSATVLFADDDLSTRRLLRATLERDGYSLLEARDGEEALGLIRRHRPDAVLLDVQMPHADGLQVTRALRLDPQSAGLPVILVTGLNESMDKVLGLDAGATDFVTKPFDPSELRARVRAAIRTSQALQRLESVQSVLAVLANAVEAKDATTQHHCGRMAGLAIDLAQRAALSATEIEAIGYGATLHDVGKIGVPERVLLKPGPLDEEEWTQMRRHSAIGAEIVAPLRLGRQIGPIVRGHHERWDGRGYPDRLEGSAIPIGARVIGVVDAFDAMTEDRPYRAARSLDEAREEIRAGAGRQFDPDLAALFLAGLDARASGAAPAASGDPLLRGLLEPAAGGAVLTVER